MGLGILFGTLAYESAILVNPKSDLLNITSLIIEIFFGIAITFTVYLYSRRNDDQNKKQQDKISNLVEKIEKIIEEQDKIRRSREIDALDKLQSRLETVRENMKLAKESNVDTPTLPDGIREIQLKIQKIVYDSMNEIKSIMDSSEDTLVSEISNPVKIICKFHSLPETSVFVHHKEVMDEIEKAMKAIKTRSDFLKSQK